MKWHYPKVLFLMTVFLASAFLVSAASTVPAEISFGFQLFNTSTGGGLNGTHDTVFTLHEDVSDGATFLNESQRISYTNGIGHVTLRNTSGITDWSIQYRVTIKVADGSETSPRINITPVPQSLFAQNATYAINASNATFAGNASALSGTITQSQISDRTVINDIGAQSGTNITAGTQTAINITGDFSSVMTSISGTVLTIRAAIINSITTLFTSFVHFTGGASIPLLNSTNITITHNLSLERPPAECPAGTFMTQFNGTASLCTAETTGNNVTGSENVTEDVQIEGTLTVFGDSIIRTKLDIGVPGGAGGLDIGEGGSYTKHTNGSTIAKVFSYDVSASSGSRFTELTLDASNTLLADAGDRLYVGSLFKFWGARFDVSTEMAVDAPVQFMYYNGSVMRNMSHMVLLKNNATTQGENLFNQSVEDEYATWEHDISDSWNVGDNVLDVIPNGTVDMFWVAFEVPSVGLTNAPVVDEIKIRGTDFDFVSGASYPVFWGDARVVKHDRIPLTIVKSPGGITTAAVDIDSAHKQTLFVLDGAGDDIAFIWILPEAIDTSSNINVRLDYSTTAVDTYDLNLSMSRLLNITPIGAGVDPDFISSTAITPGLANVVYTERSLTPDGISIQNMSSNDMMSFEIERTDSTNTLYPFSVTIHYTIFSTGELVNG